jgi:hypothetical protein
MKTIKALREDMDMIQNKGAILYSFDNVRECLQWLSEQFRDSPA